jgi:hypothetical protein
VAPTEREVAEGDHFPWGFLRRDGRQMPVLPASRKLEANSGGTVRRYDGAGPCKSSKSRLCAYTGGGQYEDEYGSPRQSLSVLYKRRQAAEFFQVLS